MKTSLIGGAVAALLLGACGGGGSGSAAGTAPVPAPTPPAVEARIYHLPVQTVGDILSYKYDGWGMDSQDVPQGPSLFYYANQTTVMTNPGQVILSSTASRGAYPNQLRYFTAEGAVTLDGTVNYLLGKNCQFQFAPAYFAVPATVTAGLTWDNRSVMSCASKSLQYDVRSQGSFVAFETLTVAAGTFDTVKLHYVETASSAADNHVVDYTEWRDMVTGNVVKRIGIDTRSQPNISPRFKLTIELAGYRHAASGREKANIERWAGQWSGTYSGGGSGTCALQVGETGELKGNCTAAGGSLGSSVAIAGTVDANGVANFSLSANGVAGPTFSGTFTSPLSVSGIWSSPGATGTWKMTHD